MLAQYPDNDSFSLLISHIIQKQMMKLMPGGNLNASDRIVAGYIHGAQMFTD